MTPDFRLANDSDIDAVVEFSRRLNEEDPDFTGDFHFDEAGVRQAATELVADPALGRLWLIEQQNATIGYVALCFGFSLESHGRDAVIDEIYLLPEFRGQGIGTAAMQFVEAKARQLGVKRLFLEAERANLSAVALYQKLGFEDLGRFLLNKYLR
jgi:ribosomal protein S18 acetylase RimI-like enzyme